MSYFLENFINDECHTFLLNSIPESSIFWHSPQILELCCLSSLDYCGSLVLVEVWFVKEICVFTFFSDKYSILKMLCVIYHQILFFFLSQNCLLIYSLTGSGIHLSHHEIQQCHRISLLPSNLEFNQWMLGWALEVAFLSTLTFAWS